MPRAFNSLSPRAKFAKRHYECIALAMQEAAKCNGGNSLQWSDGFAAGLIAIRNELADVFARDNGMFKRERFIAACVPGANVRARNGGSR